MGFWIFSRKPTNPLDRAALRAVDDAIGQGELRAAAESAKQARAELGDHPAVRYLEARCYHQAERADAAELLTHLEPALAGEAAAGFPEARLLRVELLAALGRLEEARAQLAAMSRERIRGPLGERVAGLAQQLQRLGSEGARELRGDAEALAADLAREELVIRWRPSDFARLDSMLDEHPERIEKDRDRFLALLAEIACRTAEGRLRLGLRRGDLVVRLGERDWRPAQALADRATRGLPLYAAFHRARHSRFQELPGLIGAEVHVEPGVHLTVVADHAARAAAAAGAQALGVFRERPTPDGPVVLPLSFLDKGGELRVCYIETRVWEPDRLNELRRWLGRIRASGARAAAVSLLSAHEAPRPVIDLIEGRAEIPPVPSILADPRQAGARAATPRSIDAPRLDWLDQRAEMMERLVAAALGSGVPSDLELVKKIQQTVVASLRHAQGELSPKQWNALYGYGALYGRLLARGFQGRWTALGEDLAPAEWELELPWGRRVRPIALIVDLGDPASSETALVKHFLDVKAEAEV